MSKSRKTWLWLAAGIALAALVLILSQTQRVKATSLPPSGPHQAGDLWMADLAGKTTMAMVWCPPGKFIMGSPASEIGHQSDETQHEVTLSQGFWIGKYEVTQGQWQAVMGTVPSGFPVVHRKVWKWQVPVWRKNFLVSRWRFPVESVTWDVCQSFCQKAGSSFRLPTEAEWEYACLAGGRGSFAGSGILKEMAWFGDNSGGKTHPVGRKKPNFWGLYDMHGNVWEWCQDWYGDYPTGAVTAPLGSSTGEGRVIRGGSWGHDAACCRAAFRGRNEPGNSGLALGFRVAFGITPQAKPEAEKTQEDTAHQ